MGRAIEICTLTQIDARTSPRPAHLLPAPPPRSACLYRSCRPSPAARSRCSPSSRRRRPPAARTCAGHPRRGRRRLRRGAEKGEVSVFIYLYIVIRSKRLIVASIWASIRVSIQARRLSRYTVRSRLIGSYNPSSCSAVRGGRHSLSLSPSFGAGAGFRALAATVHSQFAGAGSRATA